MPLIAISDGHGANTAGKRTPQFSNGQVMRENEFNKEVANQLNQHLLRCGFKTLLVAPTDADTPLIERTNLANQKGADLYIAIHANAAGSGTEWNNARGIETFHYDAKSKKAADIIHRHLMCGTKLPDRGVKTGNLHEVREPKMMSVLVECGFMTNLEDAKLLMSDAYRKECAEELARGICEIFSIPYVREEVEQTKVMRPIRGRVNGQAVSANSYMIDGSTYVPMRWIAETLGATVVWDSQKQEYDIYTKGL